MIQSRRGFISGLGALFVAAPAIVRAASIMPVKAIEDAASEWSPFYTIYPIGKIFIESTARGYGDWFERLFVDGIPIIPDGTFNVPSGAHTSSIGEWVTPLDLPQDIT
jgi:hypothetical protein